MNILSVTVNIKCQASSTIVTLLVTLVLNTSKMHKTYFSFLPGQSLGREVKKKKITWIHYKWQCKCKQYGLDTNFKIKFQRTIKVQGEKNIPCSEKRWYKEWTNLRKVTIFHTPIFNKLERTNIFLKSIFTWQMHITILSLTDFAFKDV